jgi:hypothetical protein
MGQQDRPLLTYRAGVITHIDGLKRWASRARERYGRWEARVASGRLSGWSVRRRWIILVLVPTVLVCCGGTVIGVPVAWALRLTIEASKGEKTPDAAVNVYLLALGYNNEDGLLPVLDNRSQDSLLSQWRAYRDAMQGTDPKPSRLDFGSLDVTSIRAGRAEVTTGIAATWWGTDGRAESYRSQEHAWVFETREDNGWQVSAVRAYPWCGGYVRVDVCQSRR